MGSYTCSSRIEPKHRTERERTAGSRELTSKRLAPELDVVPFDPQKVTRTMARTRNLMRAGLGIGVMAAALWTTDAQAAPNGFTWDRATIQGGPRFGSDDLNFGLGLNGGYTLGQGVYLGGLFNYFLGETNEFRLAGVETEAGFDAWFLMFDGGYDIGLSRAFVLRPSLALGLATAHAEVCVRGPGTPDGCTSDSNSEFEAALGGNAIFDAGGLTLGGELRLFFGEFDGVWMGFNLGGVL